MHCSVGFDQCFFEPKFPSEKQRLEDAAWRGFPEDCEREEVSQRVCITSGHRFGRIAKANNSVCLLIQSPPIIIRQLPITPISLHLEINCVS